MRVINYFIFRMYLPSAWHNQFDFDSVRNQNAQDLFIGHILHSVAHGDKMNKMKTDSKYQSSTLYNIAEEDPQFKSHKK